MKVASAMPACGATRLPTGAADRCSSLVLRTCSLSGAIRYSRSGRDHLHHYGVAALIQCIRGGV
jgi:hypothetical protein